MLSVDLSLPTAVVSGWNSPLEVGMVRVEEWMCLADVDGTKEKPDFRVCSLPMEGEDADGREGDPCEKVTHAGN